MKVSLLVNIFIFIAYRYLMQYYGYVIKNQIRHYSKCCAYIFKENPFKGKVKKSNFAHYEKDGSAKGNT